MTTYQFVPIRGYFETRSRQFRQPESPRSDLKKNQGTERKATRGHLDRKTESQRPAIPRNKAPGHSNKRTQVVKSGREDPNSRRSFQRMPMGYAIMPPTREDCRSPKAHLKITRSIIIDDPKTGPDQSPCLTNSPNANEATPQSRLIKKTGSAISPRTLKARPERP